MHHIDRQSIKSIFLLIQSIVILSVAAILITNIWMINGFHTVMETTANKNEVLSNIFDYNSVFNSTIYQYVQRPDEEMKAEYERQKASCMEEFDELMEDISLQRTRVMFLGLKNMYLHSFEYADAAILCRDRGEVERAYAQYRELVKNAGLISDVFGPMHSLNTKDMHSYLEAERERSRISTRVILISQLLAMMFIIGILTHEMREIKKKIAGLDAYADNVSRRQYDEKPVQGKTESRNELDKLGITMAKMAESIQQYVAIIEEKDRQALQLMKAENEYLKLYGTMRDAQIKALNSQINPHFLYNTLGIVSQLCYLERAEKAGRMLECVIDTFQYITRAANNITDLKSEIEFLKNYFYICSVRYENKIHFKIRRQGDIPNIRLPGMLLQPIVENAVLHGLANCRSDGEVTVSFSCDTKNIYITTEDNGEGMNYENIEEIMASETERDGHIGVSNVIKRLHLYFGKQADITISSEKDCGTIVTIILPVI